jgi:hypothetical protein
MNLQTAPLVWRVLNPVGVEGDKGQCVQNVNVLYKPVDCATGVAGADPVSVEGDKEQCVQNVLYEPVDGAAGVAGADPLGCSRRQGTVCTECSL